MVVVSRHIHIDAPVDRVFALMANPAARAALNPFVTPLRVLRVRRCQEELLEQRLGVNLERWLEAIRAHLEKNNDQDYYKVKVMTGGWG